MEEIILNCSICDAIFADVQSLNEHMSTHLQTCSSKYSLCGENSDNRYSQIKHINKHVGMCSGSYSMQDNTKQFIEIIHKNNSSFVCFICYETFTDKGILDTHTLSHKKEKDGLNVTRFGAIHKLYDLTAINEAFGRKNKADKENMGYRKTYLQPLKVNLQKDRPAHFSNIKNHQDSCYSNLYQLGSPNLKTTQRCQYLQCFECQKMILRTNINLHILNKHSRRSILTFNHHSTCPVCYLVILNKNLIRHIRNIHPGYNKQTFENNVLDNDKYEADDLALEDNLSRDESSMVDNLMGSVQVLGNLNVNIIEEESKRQTLLADELCILDSNYVRCEECNLVILKKNLSRHRKNLHEEQARSTCYCCGLTCKPINLRDHFLRVHKFTKLETNSLISFHKELESNDKENNVLLHKDDQNTNHTNLNVPCSFLLK